VPSSVSRNCKESQKPILVREYFINKNETKKKEEEVVVTISSNLL
jgi:hypothetical protein